MITKLTEKQEAAIPEYVKKWLGIGLSTTDGSVDFSRNEKVEQILGRVYQQGDLAAPKAVFFVDSPIQGAKLAAIFAKQGTIDTDEVYAGVAAYIAKNADQISSSDVSEQLSRCGYGSFDAGWLSFYDFMQTELELDCCKPLNPLMELAQHVSFWWPFEKVCIASAKPTVINMVNGRLHCETGPSVEFADGFAVYSLNGIRVPKDVVMTPADQLDAHLILKERNAEIRREIVRKVGILRIVESLGGETISKEGNYELLLLNLGDEIGRAHV
jgi:hypothetical protein